MYIQPPKKKGSSPFRIVILLTLIAAGACLLSMQRDLIKHIQVGPTPPPTATAGDLMTDAHDLSREFTDSPLPQPLFPFSV